MRPGLLCSCCVELMDCVVPRNLSDAYTVTVKKSRRTSSCSSGTSKLLRKRPHSAKLMSELIYATSQSLALELMVTMSHDAGAVMNNIRQQLPIKSSNHLLSTARTNSKGTFAV